MRAVVQRVSKATVVVEGEEAAPPLSKSAEAWREVGSIGLGLLVLVGVIDGDKKDDLVVNVINEDETSGTVRRYLSKK